MNRLTVLYGHPKDPAEFDRYYHEVHIPIARRMKGLKGWRIGKCESVTPGEQSPYYMIVGLYAASRADLEAILASPEGQATMGGINLSQEVRDVAIEAGKQHDWNDMEILAQCNRIRFAVNGKAVLDWRDPKPELVQEGPIGLQLHSNTVPQELHFKGLKIETFPKEDKLLTVK